MSIKEKLAADLKAAMLARDNFLSETLRGLKSAILYEEVAQNKRDSGLDDDSVLTVFKREAKKRKDAADLYKKGGSADAVEKEMRELAVIQGYLPEELSEEKTRELVQDAVSALGIDSVSRADTGRIIGWIKQQDTAKSVDMSVAARIISEL